MDDKIIKKYKDLVLEKTPEYDNIMAAITVVKQYILKNKCILVGGIAIDYALRLKSQPGIYDESVIPDFDIITSTHFQDAYNIATLLARKKFTGISVINALHPSTMKVRVNFVEVCDITYIPKNILDTIPLLNYHGFNMVHAHYQYIDQHRSLSYPYENAPRETIMHRPEKDMIRHDLLYNLYPLKIINTKNLLIELKEYSTTLDILDDQCVSGFFALNYWIQEAKNMGFKTPLNFGNIIIKNNTISGMIPLDSSLVLYSNNINDLYKKLDKSKNDAKFYARLLDKLPRKIVIKNYEIFDLTQKIAAHKIRIGNADIHIANIQSIMMYLLVNYIILQAFNEKRSYAYYIGYITCRDLVTWASAQKDTKFEKFLPTAEVYGEYNLSDSYIVSYHNFSIKNKTIEIIEKNKYAQPSSVFDRDLKYGKTPSKYYEFDIKKSEIFNFGGNEIDNFLI